MFNVQDALASGGEQNAILEVNNLILSLIEKEMK